MSDIQAICAATIAVAAIIAFTILIKEFVKR